MQIPIKLSRRHTVDATALSNLRQLVASWTHTQIQEPQTTDNAQYIAWAQEAVQLELDALMHLARMRQRDLARMKQLASSGTDAE